MYKKLVLIFLFFVCLNELFSQNSFVNLTELEAKKLICHKWKLSTIEVKNKKKDVSKKSPSVYLGFLADGKMIETAGSKEFHGTWSYNHSTNILTTHDQEGKEELTVLNLTNDILVLKSKLKGIIINLWLQRID